MYIFSFYSHQNDCCNVIKKGTENIWQIGRKSIKMVIYMWVYPSKRYIYPKLIKVKLKGVCLKRDAHMKHFVNMISFKTKSQR